MEYVVLQEEQLELYKAIDALKERVNRYISLGYIPQGGISICVVGDNYYHHYSAAQAMIKVKK